MTYGLTMYSKTYRFEELKMTCRVDPICTCKEVANYTQMKMQLKHLFIYCCYIIGWKAQQFDETDSYDDVDDTHPLRERYYRTNTVTPTSYLQCFNAWSHYFEETFNFSQQQGCRSKIVSSKVRGSGAYSAPRNILNFSSSEMAF